MKRTKHKRRPFVEGALILTFTSFLSRFIGFFYRTFLSRTFGAEGMGIYQLLSPVMALSFSLCAAGIQTSVSKFVASEPSTKDYKTSLRIFITGFSLSMFLSLLCTVFLYTRADFVAVRFLKEVRCAPLLKIFALSIPFSSIHSVINGYFYGIKSTKIPAFTQITEQLVRVGSVYFICYLLQTRKMAPSIACAVTGLAIGECVSALLSLAAIYLRFSRLQALKGSFGFSVSRYNRYFPLLGRILTLSAPLTANRITINLLQSVEAVSIPGCLIRYGLTNSQALSTYGVLNGMALPVVLFPSALINSVCVLLLPVISEAQAVKNLPAIRAAVRKSIKYCSLFGVLCTALFLLFGRTAGEILFHNDAAGSFILTLSFICPFLYLSGTLSSILHGLGKMGVTFLFNVIALSIRLVFVFTCIPLFGIRGYLWGLLVSQLAVTLFDYLAVTYYTSP